MGDTRFNKKQKLKGKTVGSHDRESAEGGWNMMQKGELNEDIGN